MVAEVVDDVGIPAGAEVRQNPKRRSMGIRRGRAEENAVAALNEVIRADQTVDDENSITVRSPQVPSRSVREDQGRNVVVVRVQRRRPQIKGGQVLGCAGEAEIGPGDAESNRPVGRAIGLPERVARVGAGAAEIKLALEVGLALRVQSRVSIASLKRKSALSGQGCNEMGSARRAVAGPQPVSSRNVSEEEGGMVDLGEAIRRSLQIADQRNCSGECSIRRKRLAIC